MRRWWLAMWLCLAGCGDDDEGVDQDALPGRFTASGDFAVTTTIDLTVGAVLPEPAAAYLDILHRLRDDPGAAFFDLLDAAGVPLVDELRAALPDIVEDRVAGWIADAIPAPLRAELDVLLATAELTLARVDVLSDLELPPLAAGGRSTATHRLRALRFAAGDRPIEIAIAESAVPPLVTSVSVEARVTRGLGGADGRLALADHVYGLQYGEAVYLMLERTAQERMGVGLREALGELVDCPAVAAEVSMKCVLSVCVGHRAELESLCEWGLDEAVDRLHEKLAELRFDALRLAGGTADMWDAPAAGAAQDGVLDRLSGGVWQASLDLGMGPRQVPASFVGARR